MKKLLGKPLEGNADSGGELDEGLNTELRDLYSFMELNLLIAQVITAEEVGWLVVTAMPSLLEVGFMAVGLKEVEDGRWLVVGQQDKRPLDATVAQEMASLLADGLADRSFDIIGSLLLADLPEASGRVPEPLTKLGLKSVLVVPVRTIASRFGVMMVGSKAVEKYTSKQRLLIGTVANHTAVALENASLIRQPREAEERYRAIFEQAADSIMLIDVETGALVEFNDRAHESLGYTREEFEKLKIPDFEVIESADEVANHIEKIIKEVGDTFETKHRTKGGDIRDIQVSSRAISIGGRDFVQSIWRDITERRRMEEALRESEERYRELADSITDVFFAMDKDLIYTYWNQASEELTGISATDALGKRLYDLFPNAEMTRRAEEVYLTVLRTKQPQHFTIEYELGGKDYVFEISAYPTEDGLSVFTRDITERKLAEEALRESEARYRDIASSIPGLVYQFLLKKDGSISIPFMSESPHTIYSMTAEEIEADPSLVFSMVVPEDLDLINRAIAKSARTMKAGGVEFRIKTKSGETRWVRDIYRPHLLPNGSIVWNGVILNITEHKLAEEALQQRNRELSALNTIAQSLSQSMRLDEVLQVALDRVLQTMNLPRGGIWLLDEDTGELDLAIHTGAGEEFTQTVRRLPLGVSITGKVAATGKTVVTTNLPEDERLAPGLKRVVELEKLRSLISVALQSKGKTLGVINLISYSHRCFARDDIELLETIGNEIAVAIESAQLFEKLSSLSITDELTGLYNRRHFYEVLETEMYRTERYGRPFSLVVLDLDGFKEYNDRFGHTNGDAVLRSLAQTLKSALRKADMAFRYGGDEFAIILPATDADRAKKIMGRVRLKWLQMTKAQHFILETPLGFSAGIAQYPENAETADGLVFLADTALCHAKIRGGYACRLVSDLGILSPDVLHAATMDQVSALAATVDARDPYTYGHSRRVAAISETLGKAIGLSKRELADLHVTALLHDIGKVGIPDSILTKPGKPTEDEWELIKKHSAEGARIVGYVKGLSVLVPTVLHHHERYDGTGYPGGLKGEDIPLTARIISIADAYDTMSTPRLYRDVMSHDEALEELRRHSGTQFDPELVKTLCQAMNEAIKDD